MSDKKSKPEVGIPLRAFVGELLKNNLGPVIEVPCSYLKDFLNYLWDTRKIRVVNPANEAIAMGIAAGEYLGSGKIPVVAIQNSGLLNTLNAVTSLNQIYQIPVFIIVTWRGKGGEGFDAPEHDITGRDLLKILKTFNLDFEVAKTLSWKQQVNRLVKVAKKTRKPVVFVVKKNTFPSYPQIRKNLRSYLSMSRFDAVKAIKSEVGARALFISGTGFPTRDSYNAKDTADFYIVGSMGHAFPVALGLSYHTKKKIIILDGDGGALMHAGSFASLESDKNKNIIYVILDNGAYESTGGQPTVSESVEFLQLGKTFGFRKTRSISSKRGLVMAVRKSLKEIGPTLLHVKVKMGDNAGGRVSDKYSCSQITKRFVKELKSDKKTKLYNH